MFKVDAMIAVAILTVSIKCDLRYLTINCSGPRDEAGATDAAQSWFNINEDSEYYLENGYKVFKGRMHGKPYEAKFFTQEQLALNNEELSQVATEIDVGKNIMSNHPLVINWGTCFGNADFMYYGRYAHGKTLRQNISDGTYSKYLETTPLLPLYLAFNAVELIESFNIKGVAFRNFGSDNLYHKNGFDIFSFNFSKTYYDRKLSDNDLAATVEQLVDRENIRLENEGFLKDYKSLQNVIVELFALGDVIYEGDDQLIQEELEKYKDADYAVEGKPIQNILFKSFESFFNKLENPIINDSNKKMVEVFIECARDANTELIAYGDNCEDKRNQIQQYQQNLDNQFSNEQADKYLELVDFNSLADSYANEEFDNNPPLREFVEKFLKAMMYFESFQPKILLNKIVQKHFKLVEKHPADINYTIRSLGRMGGEFLRSYDAQNKTFGELEWESKQYTRRLII